MRKGITAAWRYNRVIFTALLQLGMLAYALVICGPSKGDFQLEIFRSVSQSPLQGGDCTGPTEQDLASGDEVWEFQKSVGVCRNTVLLVLIFMGRNRWVQALVSGAVVPLLLSVVYTALVLTYWGETKGGFGSLAAVQALFSNDWMLLAGWVHYLAFDLFVGSWEVRDAQRHRISQWVVIPCLILTFLFGPAGLLLYGAVRTFMLRGLTLSELCADA